jgi:VWFA-related protein
MRRVNWIFATLFAGAVASTIAQDAPFSFLYSPLAKASDEARGLIQLDVVVTDRSGAPVTGLGAQDFSLLENGQPQKILSFQAFDGVTAKADPPVQIILVLDTIQVSESISRAERVALESFLRANGGKLKWPTAVYWLTDTGLWMPAHPSGDGNMLAHDIEHSDLKLARPLVGSRYGRYGMAAIPTSEQDPPTMSALKSLGQIATGARRLPGRKLMIWIGPGSGMGSGATNITFGEGKNHSESPFYTVCWFSTLLREARVALYSLAVGETEPKLQYQGYLAGVESAHKAGIANLDRKVLAVQSGGRVMDESFDPVAEIKSCLRDANAFYTLTFDPSHADHPDEYHDLKVEVNRAGVTARTNTGYYDQPFYSVEPVPAVRRVSVAELQKLVYGSAGSSDEDVARELDALELTQRLSGPRLAAIASKLRGKKSRLALVVLADASTFMSPPEDEIPAGATPDGAEQEQMLLKTVDYLKATIPKLPDLFARQVTVRYQETPGFREGQTNVEFQPLHVIDTLKATVHYRAGLEVADPESNGWKQKWNSPQLITYGTFGPVLAGVTQAIAEHGQLTWSHWEHGEGGKVAVFRYTVPAEKSHYVVALCCLPDREGRDSFALCAGYHGVIAIDPGSGAILRLEWDAELKSSTPLTRSQIVIEYGPVEIAGKTYICPLRSISLVRSRSVDILGEWDESFRTYGPYATMLNDVTFSGYHVFRSESRILPGFN